MKKYLLAATAAFICAFAAIPAASAQTALFTYNNGTGTPAAGTYTPGSTFTFSIMLTFAPGGNVSNLEGLSYWFQQLTAAPFISSITLRDVTGSQFTDLQTPGLTYPQSLSPSNPNDLGALLPNSTPADGVGSYLIANITVAISTSAPDSGTYVLDDVTSGGKTSVITDSAGHTFDIPEADYTITMVPEPATWLVPSLALATLLFARRRLARL